MSDLAEKLKAANFLLERIHRNPENVAYNTVLRDDLNAYVRALSPEPASKCRCDLPIHPICDQKYSETHRKRCGNWMGIYGLHCGHDEACHTKGANLTETDGAVKP